LGREIADSVIFVNCVAPGPIDTDMIRDLGPEAVKAMISDSPLKRRGTADEVAHMVAWLCSDASRFNTGAVIDMSGGRARYRDRATSVVLLHDSRVQFDSRPAGDQWRSPAMTGRSGSPSKLPGRSNMPAGRLCAATDGLGPAAVMPDRRARRRARVTRAARENTPTATHNHSVCPSAAGHATRAR
jgi:uncharacterized protein YfiM (DUF2279 family)